MKFRCLLIVLLIIPFFTTAQTEEVIAKPHKWFSFYGGMQFQFTSFSDVNEQIRPYDIPKLDYGMIGLQTGIQMTLPNTKFSTSIEGSFSETCPEEIEEYETQVLVRAYGYKIEQAAKVFEKNGFALKPTFGFGFQRSIVKLSQDISTDESGGVGLGFDSKSISQNYYTEIGLAFEKEVETCEKSNQFYIGGSIGFRGLLGNTLKLTPSDEVIIDLTKTNFNHPVLDFYFKVDLF